MQDGDGVDDGGVNRPFGDVTASDEPPAAVLNQSETKPGSPELILYSPYDHNTWSLGPGTLR